MNTETINEINKAINKELWFDFQIKSFDGYILTIIGGIDLSYSWKIEIIFMDVSFCCLKNQWKNNDLKTAVAILHGEEAVRLNKFYNIEKGYSLFRISHEDVSENDSNAYLIAAKDISYNIQ